MKLKAAYLGTHPSAQAPVERAELTISGQTLVCAQTVMQGITSRSVDILRVSVTDLVAGGIDLAGQRTGNRAIDTALITAERRRRGSDPIVGYLLDGPTGVPALVAFCLRPTEVLKLQAAVRRVREQHGCPPLADLLAGAPSANGAAEAAGIGADDDDLDGDGYDDAHTDVDQDDVTSDEERRALRYRIADALSGAGWSVSIEGGDQLRVEESGVFLNFGPDGRVALYRGIDARPRIPFERMVAFSTYVIGPSVISYEAANGREVVAAQLVVAIPEEVTDLQEIARWLERAMSEVYSFSRLPADFWEADLT